MFSAFEIFMLCSPVQRVKACETSGSHDGEKVDSLLGYCAV
jgi:hypothetical protein